MNHVEEFFRLKDTPKLQATYLGQHLQAINSNIKQYLKEQDEKNKQYFYLITFTLKEDLTDSQYNAVRKYIKEQFTDRPALKIKRAVIAEEFTAAGRPHWHVSVSSMKPLSKDRFNYYEKIYGNVDISKNTHKNINDGLNYISKMATPETLVDL